MKIVSSLETIFLFLTWTLPVTGRLPKKVIKIDNNGYQDVTITISQNLPQQDNENLVQNITDLFTATSEQLFKATKNHLYFKHITIVVPRTWTSKPDYQIVSGPQFDMAHVIIGERNPRVGSRPYVSGVTSCGEEGQYIHVDMYSILSGWRSRLLDKFLVHQWGHYRWGLFDEYPGTESPTLKPEKIFYLANGTAKPNVCSDQVKGRFLTDCKDPNSRCNIQDGMPESACQFCMDDDSSARQSLMGYYYHDSISQFCDDSPENGSIEIHNVYADTKQNRYCQGRSNWAVMREHSDFKGLKAASSITNTRPTFTIVQQGPHRIVLILDISGSMKDEGKLERLLQATTHFLLNVVDDDTEVGLVTFNRNARIVRSMTRMSSQQVREDFVAGLPSEAKGDTSIGAGILKGLECLKASGGVTVGSFLFIVSDGEERAAPFINSSTKEVTKAEVIVMSLAFTTSSDVQLVNLSGITGGRSFLESNKDNSTVLVNALYQTTGYTNDDNNSIILIESQRTVPVNGQIRGRFYIDDTIGRDTLLAVIGSNLPALTINVSSPNGSTYQLSSCKLRVCSLRFPGILEIGEYKFMIFTRHGESYVYTIQSRQRSESSKVITAKAWMSGPSLNLSTTSSLQVFTSVMCGFDPVLNATVRAFIDSSKSPVVLVDTGSGADLQAGDGIYSAYILPSHVTGNGRFNGRVLVENENRTAKLIVPVRRRKRDIGFLDVPKLTTVNTERFSRVTETSEFEVLNFGSSNVKDIIPPARITTLELVDADHYNRKFILQFMAVGDDLDTGIASSYDVRMSASVQELMVTPWKAPTVMNEDIPTPEEAGTLQTMRLSVQNSSLTYFVGIRAVDSNNNTGEMSNIVSLSVIHLQSLKITSTSMKVTTNTFSAASSCSGKRLTPMLIIFVLLYERLGFDQYSILYR